MALSGNEVTRQGPAGVSMGPYGSFAGKTEFVVPTVTLKENFAYEVYIRQHNGSWDHTQIVFTGTDFGEVD